MKATKTTIPLRDRCLSHCATLGIPLEGASLDEVLSRAEKENLSHLHFLDLLLGAVRVFSRDPRAIEQFVIIAQNRLGALGLHLHLRVRDARRVEQLGCFPPRDFVARVQPPQVRPLLVGEGLRGGDLGPRWLGHALPSELLTGFVRNRG